MSDDASVRFLIGLGRQLHESGFTAEQLESALAQVAGRLGVRAQFFSTPTSLFFAFGEGVEQRTHLERVAPAMVDLGRLARLDALIDRVARGELVGDDAEAALAEASRRAAPYPAWLTHLCWGLGSATSAVFLGGGWREIAVGAAIGLVTGLVARLLERRENAGRLFEPLAAGLAAFVATGAAQSLAPLSVYIATLAGVIYLIPGFTLTVALTELATRHLSSGSARFAGALVVFLTVAFGAGVGGRIGVAVFGVVPAAGPRAAADWTEWLALAVAPLALTVLFRAPLSALPWIVGIGFLGFQGGRIGAELITPELGMFVGALAVGSASRIYARVTGRPETIPLVPAILLLVPGSIGYRSLASLLERDVVPGIETAFRMLLVAVSLVAGLLLANALVPGRRR